MAFLFSTEGEVVIAIAAPSKAQCVADGVERWLVQSGASDLRREGDRIFFRGSDWSTALNPLRGVGMSSIRFRNNPEKVVMEYNVAFSRFRIWTIAALALPIAAVAGTRSILFCLFLLPILAAVVCLSSLPNGFEFRNSLQAAAIRGLADAAAAELTALQGVTREACSI